MATELLASKTTLMANQGSKLISLWLLHPKRSQWLKNSSPIICDYLNS
ncbi:hypothetical protein COO91_07797 [Nostoc flagelliforme CCNUN1]|uniref:Uncharacterized protein n=1 Tax=Nostoc flagelliforme CCNUN1 TaxID=2038116 RepID=A0A2K8T292_9NOSO|nr:hypothetical protein COO91_07797 [Nostoc flagelliforme CCNUN1]